MNRRSSVESGKRTAKIEKKSSFITTRNRNKSTNNLIFEEIKTSNPGSARTSSRGSDLNIPQVNKNLIVSNPNSSSNIKVILNINYRLF
jgi:hypothetical protein